VVQVQSDAKGRGQLRIRFTSFEHLDGLVERLRR
jgi:hypothetical protein